MGTVESGDPHLEGIDDDRILSVTTRGTNGFDSKIVYSDLTSLHERIQVFPDGSEARFTFRRPASFVLDRLFTIAQEGLKSPMDVDLASE